MRKVRRESTLPDVLDRVMENCIVLDGDARVLLACFGLVALQGRIVTASIKLWLDHEENAGTRRLRYFLPAYDPEAV